MKIHQILTFLLCLFTGITGYAQQHNFTNYSVTEGLAQSQVHAVLEDSKGYLWLGTRGGGLCRFDGKNFTTFTTQNGLASNYINALFEDKNGIIWISTANGINQFQAGKFANFASISNRVVVNDFLQETAGKIWFATNKGLYFIDNERVINFTKENTFLDQNIIHCLYQDKKEQIWVGSQKGLFKIKGNAVEEIKQVDNSSYTDVRSITATKDGVLWIAAYNQGILLSDGDKILRQLTKSDGLISTKVQILAVYQK